MGWNHQLVINYVVLRQCMYPKFNWIQLMTREHFNETGEAAAILVVRNTYNTYTLEQMENWSMWWCFIHMCF